MIRDSSFEGAGLVIFDVKGESSFQELDGEVVLADCVKNEANVAVDQGNLGMVLTDHHQGKIPGAVQQFQCGAERVKNLKLNKASVMRPLCLVESHMLDVAERRERYVYLTHIL